MMFGLPADSPEESVGEQVEYIETFQHLFVLIDSSYIFLIILNKLFDLC